MNLVLEKISKKVSTQSWLYDLDLAPPPGAVTVLLGATRAGKTSLMRIIAGLDVPSGGQILVDGKNVVGMPVRERNVSMVYQQFINYPSLTVRENIASPLKLRRAKDYLNRVQGLAEKLHIHPFLDRYPAELSGGQQQRVALARALAKEAPLMLLDEPLVNLDYKLREELREELSALFSTGEATVIYATTEPGEALLLGGYTAVMDAGELLQFGPTAEVFHHPKSLRVAKAFSDPPMNLMTAHWLPEGVRLSNDLLIPLRHAALQVSSNNVTVGLRASAVHANAASGDLSFTGTVDLVEISGSDTYVHLSSTVGPLVAQLTGVHTYSMDSTLTLYFSASQLYIFDAQGLLLRSPDRNGKH